MTIIEATSGRDRCAGCPLRDVLAIPGYGNMHEPPICFVAQSPGETEQKEGRPLIGRSGKLLRQVVTALGMNEHMAYYTNVCLCTLPTNKEPPQAMVNECYEDLIDELTVVSPKVIVTLGNTAAKAVGQYTRGVQSIRGEYKEIELEGHRIGIIPTYHPAAVLRNPDLFRDLESDLARAVDIAVHGKPAIIRPPTENYGIITSVPELDEMFDVIEAEDPKVVTVDLETITRNFMTGTIQDIGLAWKREHAVSIDWMLFEKDSGPITSAYNQAIKRNRDRLREVIKRPVSMQEASYDIPWLRSRGFRPNLKFDTAIAHWLIDERMGGHDLDSMASQFYSAPAYKQMIRRKYGIGAYVDDENEFAALWTKIPDQERRIYNATDCDYTLRLTLDLKEELKAQGMLKLMQLLIDATLLYADLYFDGMHIDWDYVEKLHDKLTKRMEKARRVVEEMAPGVNIASPKQLAVHLYDVLQLSPFGLPADNRAVPEDLISSSIQSVTDPEAREYWQTARIALYEGAGTKDEGRGLRSRSTGAFMLYWLAQQHDFPRYVIAYKRAKKAIATYIGNIVEHSWPDGVVRPDYKLNGTLHGRFKTSRPAIHNLTAGPELYDMFTAPPGFTILHADFSQADMRMMAHFSGDEGYVAALQGDPHTEVVKQIMHVDDEYIAKMPRDELKKRRMAAKMVNFGLPYGRSAANLAPQMGMTVMEAQEYIRAYWRRFPRLKAWMDGREGDLMRHDQELTSPFKNKRRFPLILDRSHRREAARLAVNFPVMASVNYMTCLAHIRAVNAIRDLGIKVYVYPHIHDSINVCVPDDLVDEIVPLVIEIMEDVPHYIGINTDKIPFPIEIDAGFHWGTQQHVYENAKQVPYDREKA